MKKEQLMGVIRHILTFAGGILVSKGVIDETSSSDLIGAMSTFIGVVWSIIAKDK